MVDGTGGEERRDGVVVRTGEERRAGEGGEKWTERWEEEAGRRVGVWGKGGGREEQRQRHKALRWGWWRSDRWMRRGHWGQTGQTQVEEAAGRTKTTRHQPW